MCISPQNSPFFYSLLFQNSDSSSFDSSETIISETSEVEIKEKKFEVPRKIVLVPQRENTETGQIEIPGEILFNILNQLKEPEKLRFVCKYFNDLILKVFPHRNRVFSNQNWHLKQRIGIFRELGYSEQKVYKCILRIISLALNHELPTFSDSIKNQDLKRKFTDLSDNLRTKKMRFTEKELVEFWNQKQYLVRKCDRESLPTIIEAEHLLSATSLNLRSKNLNTFELPDEIKAKKLRILDIAKNNFGYFELFPEQVADFRALTCVDMSSNHLTFVSPTLSNLSNLRILNLSNNDLQLLPPELGLLINLTNLKLSTNKIFDLPGTFSQLTDLEVLDLYSNRLTTIPESICDLPQLSTLDLKNNQITFIPTSLSWPSLIFLFLERNQIQLIPFSFGSLTSLKKLTCSINKLRRINPKITALRNLVELDLFQNKLSRLPNGFDKLKRLRILNLTGNRFTHISNLSNLRRIEYLYLSGNPLVKVPDLGKRDIVVSLSGTKMKNDEARAILEKAGQTWFIME